MGRVGFGRDRRKALLRWGAGSLVTLLLFGCGGNEGDGDSERSMVATSQSAKEGSGDEMNHAPLVQQIMIRPSRPAPGRSVQVVAKVSDPDGDATRVEYRWQTASGRALATGKVFDTTGLEPGQHLEVVATASDGEAESEPVVHEFQLARMAASISLVEIDTSEGTRPGAPLEAVIDIDDDESGRIEAVLEWKVNGEVVGSEEKLETGRFSPGDIVILRAHLDVDGRRTRSVSSPAVVLSRGEAPEILSKPLAGIEGGLFRYQIRARSPEPEAELTFALLEGPEGMSVGAKTGLVEWRPESDQRGRFEVEVSATDQWGTGVAQSFTIVADAPGSSPARPR